MAINKKNLDPASLEYFREQGSKGGKKTLRLHGKKHFKNMRKKQPKHLLDSK